MKTVRIITFILALAMMCCMFVACNEEDVGDVVLPERDFYEVTVSFQIKSADGKTQIEALDYTYKGHAEPTMLTVINSYLTIVEEWTCKIDKTNTLVQIGGMKASKKDGEYWGFVMCKRNSDGSIKNGALNLSMDYINKNLSDGKMGETMVQNGDEFTVILITSED